LAVQDAPSADYLPVESTSLDSMSYAQLLERRMAVKTAITTISTHLMTQERRPPTREDDSPAWATFREWRRRARSALLYRRKEFEYIKKLLRERQNSVQQTRQQRLASLPLPSPESILHTPEEYQLLSETARERRVALLDRLNGEGGADTLVLRLYRVARHLIGEGDGFPPQLDPSDIDAVKAASIYLRSKYTSGGVHRYVRTAYEDLPSNPEKRDGS
jgi:hypothetical protein